MLALRLVLAPILLAVPVPKRNLPESAWVGKTILIRTSGTTMDPADLPDERTPPMPGNGVALTGIQYRVYAERPNHILVKTREGVSGWVRKTDAVLLDEAVAAFSQRLAANPNDMDALSRRASAWRLKGELDAALRDASEAIRLNPHPALFNNRALIWSAKKNFDQAIADYSQAISLNPNYALAYANRAFMWFGKKDFDKAIEDASHAIRIDPRQIGAYRTRGVAWHAKKDYDKAIEEFAQVLRLDPRSAQAFTDRGRSWSAKKNYPQALADFNEAVRLEPTNVTSACALALWLSSCPEPKFRDGQRALELAKNAQQQERNDSTALEALAAAHAELGQFDDAVRWQERALLDPQRKTDDDARRRLERYRNKQPYRQE